MSQKRQRRALDKPTHATYVELPLDLATACLSFLDLFEQRKACRTSRLWCEAANHALEDSKTIVCHADSMSLVSKNPSKEIPLEFQEAMATRWSERADRIVFASRDPVSPPRKRTLSILEEVRTRFLVVWKELLKRPVLHVENLPISSASQMHLLHVIIKRNLPLETLTLSGGVPCGSPICKTVDVCRPQLRKLHTDQYVWSYIDALLILAHVPELESLFLMLCLDPEHETCDELLEALVQGSPKMKYLSIVTMAPDEEPGGDDEGDPLDRLVGSNDVTPTLAPRLCKWTQLERLYLEQLDLGEVTELNQRADGTSYWDLRCTGIFSPWIVHLGNAFDIKRMHVSHPWDPWDSCWHHAHFSPVHVQVLSVYPEGKHTEQGRAAFWRFLEPQFLQTLILSGGEFEDLLPDSQAKRLQIHTLQIDNAEKHIPWSTVFQIKCQRLHVYSNVKTVFDGDWKTIPLLRLAMGLESPRTEMQFVETVPGDPPACLTTKMTRSASSLKHLWKASLVVSGKSDILVERIVHWIESLHSIGALWSDVQLSGDARVLISKCSRFLPE